jgi:hypothetical protein
MWHPVLQQHHQHSVGPPVIRPPPPFPAGLGRFPPLLASFEQLPDLASQWIPLHPAHIRPPRPQFVPAPRLDFKALLHQAHLHHYGPPQQQCVQQPLDSEMDHQIVRHVLFRNCSCKRLPSRQFTRGGWGVSACAVCTSITLVKVVALYVCAGNG